MKNTPELDEETTEAIVELSYKLSTLKHSFNLLKLCIEEDIYSKSVVEQISFAYLIEDFICQIYNEYLAIEDRLNIAR